MNLLKSLLIVLFGLQCHFGFAFTAGSALNPTSQKLVPLPKARTSFQVKQMELREAKKEVQKAEQEYWKAEEIYQKAQQEIQNATLIDDKILQVRQKAKGLDISWKKLQKAEMQQKTRQELLLREIRQKTEQMRLNAQQELQEAEKELWKAEQANFSQKIEPQEDAKRFLVEQLKAAQQKVANAKQKITKSEQEYLMAQKAEEKFWMAQQDFQKTKQEFWEAKQVYIKAEQDFQEVDQIYRMPASTSDVYALSVSHQKHQKQKQIQSAKHKVLKVRQKLDHAEKELQKAEETIFSV